MLARLFRRLFGRPRKSAPPRVVEPDVPVSLSAPADTAAPVVLNGTTEQTPAPVIAIVADTQAVAAAEGPAPFDAAATYQERLTVLRSSAQEEPALYENPDVTALIQLLGEGPDATIRQLPAAARDALALCEDSGLSRSQVAGRLSADPALVQGLLRMANSATMAAGRAPVLGIEQALDRIGVVGARAVVLASCVDGLLSHPGGEYNAMASDVWSHMVRTAPLARALAPAFAADSDEAFAIAVLHDVGKLVVFDRISTLRSVRRRNVSFPAPFIRQLLADLHEPLGALAVQKWGMGERAAAAIGTHHRSTVLPVRDSLAETIFVAERADHAMRSGMPFDLDVLWADGRLTGSPARAASALQKLASAA